jgi:hypothetical protein
VSDFRVLSARDRAHPPGPRVMRREPRRSSAPRDDGGPPASADPTANLPRALKAIGSIVAPASLITALMFYFGVNHAAHFFSYFGVNYTVMGLTTQDFLVRSVDGLFLPLAIVAAGALSALWLQRLSSGRLSGATVRNLKRKAVVVLLVVGTVALKLALAGFLRPVVFRQYYGLPGLCLAGGVLLLALASHLHYTTRRDGGPPPPPWAGVSEWAALFVVVSAGLFWAVTDYSARVGQTRGFNTQQQLASAPEAIVYSQDRLSLPTMSANEVECPHAEGEGGTYRYRYGNLRLVFASEGQYLLLPSRWPDEGGIAFVLPRSDGLRLEFVRDGLEQGATC